MELDRYELPTIGVEQAKNILRSEANMPPSIRSAIKFDGPPGCGKTEGVIQVANGNFSLTNMTQCNPDAVTSSPFADVKSETVKEFMHQRFAEVYTSAKACDPDPYYHVLDEWSGAHVECQKVLAEYVNCRTINGKMMPRNVVIVLTGNSADDSAGVHPTLSHLISRMKVYKMWYNVKDMLAYAIKRKWHSHVLGFLNWKPSALFCDVDTGTPEDVRNQLKQTKKKGIPAGPNPRSWERLSNLLKYTDRMPAWNAQQKELGNPEVFFVQPELHDFCALLGRARGEEFNKLRGMDIPNHPDLIEGRREFPEDIMTRWMCVINCAEKLTVGNAKKTLEVILKLPANMVQLFLTVAGQTAIEYHKEQSKKTGGLALPTFKGFNEGELALYSFPGFRGVLFDPSSPYGKAKEAV